ncbi:hypothetical protein D3C81_1363370 [compost metagenome]
MHGDVLGGGFVAVELDHHADTGAVQVRHQLAAVGVADKAANRQVFADLADQGRAGGFNAHAVEVQRRQGSHVGRVLLGDQFGNLGRERQEVVVLGDEIGLAVQFDQHAGGAVDERSNHAFGGHARGGLAGLVAQLDAQQLFGLVQVAVGLGQGLLAFHHRRVGLRAQFCNHACGNCRHLSLLEWFAPGPAVARGTRSVGLQRTRGR